MDLDIKLGNRTSKLHLLSRKGNMVKIAVDDRIYDLDLLMVERGVYSVLYDGESYNMELIIGDNSKNYYVNSRYHSYEIEIIDAQTKYQRSRSNKNQGAGSETISSPMPGKIIKILVKPGEKVTAGTITIIVEAMKMQSEYKVTHDCAVKQILVKEGDTVSSNQVLIEFEDIEQN
jgi:biotin carboxyl carrier protein